MKKHIVLLIALAAGSAWAQPSSPDRTFDAVAEPSATDRQAMLKAPEKRHAVHHGRLAYDGAAVEAVKAPGHLEIFNPFDRDNAPATDNTVWQDRPTGRALGWSIFSIKF